MKTNNSSRKIVLKRASLSKNQFSILKFSWGLITYLKSQWEMRNYLSYRVECCVFVYTNKKKEPTKKWLFLRMIEKYGRQQVKIVLEFIGKFLLRLSKQ